MREIPLSNGKGAVALVDDADHEWLSQFKWSRHPQGYAHAWIRGRGVTLMHRLILDAQRGQEIDHIDRNPANNQRSNLRFCTRSENIRNRRSWALNARCRFCINKHLEFERRHRAVFSR